MPVKDQRNRFMAFAFACADLLVEVDGDGRILYAMGSVGPLGERDAGALEGRRVRDLVRPAHQPLLEQLVAGLRPGRRAGPAPMTAAGADEPPISVSAVSLPSAPGRAYVAIAFTAASAAAATVAPRSTETGLVDAASFSGVAEDALTTLHVRGADALVTLLSLKGEDRLLDRLTADAAAAYHRKLGALLRASSTGDAATSLGAGAYSVVHDEDLDANALRDSIDAAARDADPKGVGVTIGSHSFQIDPSLPPADAARALAYTISRFAEGALGGERDDMAAMCQALEGDMRSTGARMAQFKRAIADREICFLAQPIVDLKTRRPRHYELLVRFEKDRSPFSMVHFAEQTGVVAELDLAALDTAADFLKNHAPLGFPGLAVNISGASVANPKFVTRLLAALAAHHIDPKSLAFEITESSRISDLGAAHDVIQRIRKTGHAVFLDDFGAGAASFQYLRALEIDAVKIDGGYVQSAARRKKDAMLLKAMTELCRDIGVLTVAEMVETEEQMRHLTRLGVDMCQGYLVGRPTPLAALAADTAA